MTATNRTTHPLPASDRVGLCNSSITEQGAMTVSHNSIEIDAREFGLHVKQGGWRLGLLVARSVEKGQRGGDTTSIFQSENAKVPALTFSRESGTAPARILRYLAAWNRAADAGHVPHAADLTPGQEVDLDAETLPDWNTFYTGAAGDFRLPEERRDALIRQAEIDGVGRGKVQEIANNPRAMAAAIKADPKVALEAMKALDERHANAARPIPGRPTDVANDAANLVFEFRKLHRGVDQIVQLVNDGKAVVADDTRDAILREVKWLRTALGYIEDGVASNSLSDEIANFLGAQA